MSDADSNQIQISYYASYDITCRYGIKLNFLEGFALNTRPHNESSDLDISNPFHLEPFAVFTTLQIYSGETPLLAHSYKSEIVSPEGLPLDAEKIANTREPFQCCKWRKLKTGKYRSMISNTKGKEKPFEKEIKTKGEQLYWLYFELLSFDEPVYYQHHDSITETQPKDPFDPEVYLLESNPIEQKMNILYNKFPFDYLDKSLKPTPRIRDELIKICSYSTMTTFSEYEKNLLWKYRYFLAKDKKALLKILSIVDLTKGDILKSILSCWTKIDAEDCLYLLSEKFKHASIVREYAVNVFSTEAFDIYLPQLVQAMKYEETIENSPLLSFLVSKCIKNERFSILIYWLVSIEAKDKESKYYNLYQNILGIFLYELSKTTESSKIKDVIIRQEKLVTTLYNIAMDIKALKGTKKKKIERLHKLLADVKLKLVSFTPLPLPLDPETLVYGIPYTKASCFTSNLWPLKIPFKVPGWEQLYYIIFKVGDDLRQDQLAVQLINVIDKLLKNENLDLKLTPYKVLATGIHHGMIQFIASETLANILAENNNSILTYFRKLHFDPEAKDSFFIKPEIMDNYIRSCAGYCVITHVLGVGDRHLDNLLLTDEGFLFHIDFSYILGRDPKPFPPPMKLCKEMVEAMGGFDNNTPSVYFLKFRNLCSTAFCILRNHFNVFVHIFMLMKDASLPDIMIESDKLLAKVEEKFKLELSDEEATIHFHSLMNDSVNALFPQMMETIHKWAQYWRR